MASSQNLEPKWNPHERFPSAPEFYRRVLHHMPSPLLVVNAAGEITYLNHAMLELGGWEIHEEAEVNVLEYIHPDDRDSVAAAFADIIQAPSARVLGTNTRWAEIYFRILKADGTNMPVQLIGTGGLMDPAVEGLIYEVRPAQTLNLVARILDGLSQGASMHQLLTLLSEIIAAPPLDLEAAVMQSTTGGDLLLAASTSPHLSDILRADVAGLPWMEPTREPSYVPVASLPEPVAQRLGDAGFVDLWHVDVGSPLTEQTLRLIATSHSHHVPSTGPKSRLARSRELAAAVLLRSQTDVLLEYAAGPDHLTDLPNRPAFLQHVESIDPMIERAAVHVHVHGLSQIGREMGQITSDAVVRVVSDRFRVACTDTNVLGRIGDDEFAVVMTPEEHEDSVHDRASLLASTLIDAAGEPVVIAGRPLNVVASIGLAFAASGISTDHLLTWADAAMREARRSGGGRTCRYGISYE